MRVRVPGGALHYSFGDKDGTGHLTLTLTLTLTLALALTLTLTLIRYALAHRSEYRAEQPLAGAAAAAPTGGPEQHRAREQQR